MNEPIEVERKRFVLLFHQFPSRHQRQDHWDLMLESDNTLLTWALSEMPESGKSIPAVPLADHRLRYLDYQGQVSEDCGWVTQVTRGEYFWKPGTERKQAVLEFEGDKWEIEVQCCDEECLIVVK